MALPGTRRVFVVGGGLHAYQRQSQTPYVELGLTAVRRALADAGISWKDVGSAYVGTANIGMAAGTTMLRYLGATGLPVVQVENASASGSSAFRQAVVEVAGGFADVVAAIGVDKPDPRPGGPTKAMLPSLVGRLMPPRVGFALDGEKYMRDTGVTAEQVARVAVKNHKNGALNRYAHRQKPRTLEEVLAPPVVAGSLTRLQCAPRGEGAAAVIVMSQEGMRRYGIDRVAAVEVVASVCHTADGSAEPGADTRVTALSAADAYEQAGISSADLDLVELHDAFAVEELMYLEAMRVSPEGEAAVLLSKGTYDIGGACAVSASGGLLAMGHPIGPTGIGQIAELRTQLTGSAGARQHPDAQTGLAHMIGIGGVCLVHILKR